MKLLKKAYSDWIRDSKDEPRMEDAFLAGAAWQREQTVLAFKKWVAVTGFVAPGTSYYYELLSLVDGWDNSADCDCEAPDSDMPLQSE